MWYITKRKIGTFPSYISRKWNLMVYWATTLPAEYKGLGCETWWNCCSAEKWYRQGTMAPHHSRIPLLQGTACIFFHHCGKCLRFYFHMISITLHSLSCNDFLSGKEPHLAMQIYNDQWQLSDLHHLIKAFRTLLEQIVLVFFFSFFWQEVLKL